MVDEKVDSIGQSDEVWTKWWKGLTPESEIRMWDYYGLRQWITKFTPRYGKVIEAGCGLGRYNFYFSRMGIEMEGVDFSEPTITFLNEWKKKNGFDTSFVVGDVLALPYEDNSLSGYISLGVVEHFVEGPHKPLQEAFRVLRPGGIAIISTPSVSWNTFLNRSKRNIKNLVKKLIGRKDPPQPFFQHEYRPDTLKKFISDTGLMVTSYGGADILFSFFERSGYDPESIKPGKLANTISNKFEKSGLRNIGAQSIVIAVKPADKMHCFFTGEMTADISSLETYSVPVSQEYLGTRIASFFKKEVMPSYAEEYSFNPPIKMPTSEVCDFCGINYMTDELFEDYGFNKKVCSSCLKKPEINLELCIENIKPIWRKRKQDGV